MVEGYRVVAVVPAGRRKYLEILIPYLRKQKGIIDQCHFWCNTTDPDDIAFMRLQAFLDPFFTVVPPQIPIAGNQSIFHFFRTCIEAGTVYVRFDDDICWIAPDAVEDLVRFRLANREFALVYANIVNNSICSYLHQRLGCISPDDGICEYDVLGNVSHRNPAFAKRAHETFLEKRAAGELSAYRFSHWVAWTYERISINCIAWLGSDFAIFDGMVGPEEEEWLSVDYPRYIGRPTAICGTSLVVHFAYHTQRYWLEENTDLLAKYRALAMELS